jgi:hypothetical protein
MLGFVPQQVHRQRAPEASAQDAEGEQALLRDPPPPGSGCHLVIGIHAEAENVQQDENCCDESLPVCSPFFYTSNLFCCGQIILQPRCLDDCPTFVIADASNRSCLSSAKVCDRAEKQTEGPHAICETSVQKVRRVIHTR